jgi:hypothetical protein
LETVPALSQSWGRAQVASSCESTATSTIATVVRAGFRAQPGLIVVVEGTWRPTW